MAAVFFCIWLTDSMAQPSGMKGGIVIGTEVALMGRTDTDWVTGQKYRQRYYRVGPRIGLFTSSKLVVGITSEYSWGTSNFGVYFPRLYGLGGFSRYYIGMRPLHKYFNKDKVFFYTELAYSRTNFIPNRLTGVAETRRGLGYWQTSLSLGASLKPFRQFCLDIALRPYVHTGWKIALTGRVGIEYHIVSKS